MAKRALVRAVLPAQVIETKIHMLRGQRVMLDRDLAELYGVETRLINQAVKRNADRFPADFMFQLTAEEAEATLALRSQNVILKRGQHLKYMPHAFTEHGAVMLANLLRSPVAIQASIQVVRAFVHMRRMLAANEDFARKLEHIERTLDHHDSQLNSILSTLDDLFAPADEPPQPRPIGFVPVPGKA
ncbi:MAG TPA: ORF6N domain-containing protein [Bryobacteraceae bacterium]|nr:ORF6N domain-containing protein [Bryobacteraceae bacterium]